MELEVGIDTSFPPFCCQLSFCRQENRASWSPGRKIQIHDLRRAMELCIMAFAHLQESWRGWRRRFKTQVFLFQVLRLNKKFGDLDSSCNSTRAPKTPLLYHALALPSYCPSNLESKEHGLRRKDRLRRPSFSSTFSYHWPKSHDLPSTQQPKIRDVQRKPCHMDNNN
jgi:hypothetical protein